MVKDLDTYIGKNSRFSSFMSTKLLHLRPIKLLATFANVLEVEESSFYIIPQSKPGDNEWLQFEVFLLSMYLIINNIIYLVINSIRFENQCFGGKDTLLTFIFQFKSVMLVASIGLDIIESNMIRYF